MVERSRDSLLEPADSEQLSRSRVGWLIRMRWFAILGIAAAAALAEWGAFPSVHAPLLVGCAAFALGYNVVLYRRYLRGAAEEEGWAGTVQAQTDLLLLTVVLWAAGGAECPFTAYYVFHVAIVGILAGPRATQIAAVTAMVGTAFLLLSSEVPALRIATWDPVPPWDFVAEVVAFVSTVGTVAYLVNDAVSELRDRERALTRARDQAALEYELLSNTLDQLEAGLEVVASDGSVFFRNKRAEELAALPRGENACPASGHPCHGPGKVDCPIEKGFGQHEPGRCRFAVRHGGQERVYEMLTFPLATSRDGARLMNLYVDRTQATLADQRLVLAERLVSLGRVAQGVAHEINTPLATVRTLASDIRASLRQAGGLDDVARQRLYADIDESAALMHDETLRLGRITQALLAGGDLVRTKVQGEVPVAAVVERARALVFAGVRDGPTVSVAPGLERLRVTADPDRLLQVLVNLLQNAYDAVRERAPAQVLVWGEARGEEVRLTVEDDGVGLADEIRQRLFEPFATNKPHGTGLGLYTSFMLVQAMRGDLWLDPRPGGGTVATVRLPSAAREEEGRERLPAAPPRGTKERA